MAALKVGKDHLYSKSLVFVINNLTVYVCGLKFKPSKQLCEYEEYMYFQKVIPI